MNFREDFLKTPLSLICFIHLNFLLLFSSISFYSISPFFNFITYLYLFFFSRGLFLLKIEKNLLFSCNIFLTKEGFSIFFYGLDWFYVSRQCVCYQTKNIICMMCYKMIHTYIYNMVCMNVCKFIYNMLLFCYLYLLFCAMNNNFLKYRDRKKKQIENSFFRFLSL